ncbi:sugar isomerase domain-containing protein [Arundinibacter roseus]|uniref:Sugar isomerase domain-containing protein n=1 Tax=Arundinibacter roseus TaxID=2070510 RepID=A0A4R4KH36_9BACT|nr:SIS domain-containing protein [Arundinibacter roseus]TDB67374.1 sugar isomerase domain-containing protein [Arundinibacter roseus]
MSYTKQYLQKCQGLMEAVALQEDKILEVARLFANSILSGRMVHIFGSGHSRIMVEEMWPRYGSFPGFNPIVELSLTFHNLVVGANGQRQAMFLENVPGFAKQILRNFDLTDEDSALIISSSGCNVVPIELAELFQKQGIKTVGIISEKHSEVSISKRKDGLKLQDFCGIVLDSGAPIGDAMIQVENLDTPVAPGSTVGSCMIINCIKAELANLLTQAGEPPKVLTAAAIVGAERATELFQSAYDEHAHRVSRLYKKVGIQSYVSEKN